MPGPHPRPIKRWPIIFAGSSFLLLVAVIVLVGLASNDSVTPAASGNSATPAAAAVPAASPTVQPNASSTALRVEHTDRTEAVDLTLSASECHVVTVDASMGEYLPDTACTPGAIDPAVTQATISSTICASGYTASIRPPTSITGPAKTESLADYGMAASSTTEYDHLVPLELGGASSVSNLWPEPNKAGARGVDNPKDAVESALKRAVCAHTIPLAAAQVAIAKNWVTAASVLGLG